MSEASPDEAEITWRAGCYMGPYVVSTAAAIWQHWSVKEVIDHPEQFASWIEQTWPHWEIRRERRAARTVKKMTISLLSFARWASTILPKTPIRNFEDLWESANDNLTYFGRYANIKIVEALYRAKIVDYAMPDIRPKDAWSPRMTLAWLFPEDKEIINKAKFTDLAGIALINRHAEELRQALSEYMGYKISLYQIEVLLCNYRQVLDRRNGRYPGWSQDMDLQHHSNVTRHFGELAFDFYGYRKKLFPVEMLGEIQGWSAPRKEICGYKGYFWCDAIYDYWKTTDLQNPVKRELTWRQHYLTSIKKKRLDSILDQIEAKKEQLKSSQQPTELSSSRIESVST